MNYRDRDLLNLCYEFDCLLNIEGVCTGGTGEPCHANWPEFGKGAGMKAHDCYAVPGCRACHMELDQGSRLTKDERKHIWMRAFLRYLPMLWLRGLLMPGDMADILRSRPEEAWRTGLPVVEGAERTASRSPSPVRRRKSRCTAAANQVKRPAGGFA